MAALCRSWMLNTANDNRLDRITRTTKKLLGVPICLITLVDETRLLFKSHSGLDFSETPRDGAFCAHAILPSAPSVFVVRDARADERFAGNQQPCKALTAAPRPAASMRVQLSSFVARSWGRCV